MSFSFRFRLWLIRLTRFEFWPFWIFYAPMYLYGLVLALKAGSFAYFTAVNSMMKYGGAFGMSKFDALMSVPTQFRPTSIRLVEEVPVQGVLQEMSLSGLTFPLVAKPDVGERGKGVEKLCSTAELENYLDVYGFPLILQEYIDHPVELGILFYRMPDGSEQGITSVVIRDYLSITGDGKSSLSTLILSGARAAFRRKYLFDKYRDQLNVVLPEGQKMVMEPIGNHNRGARFLNGNHLINERLEAVFSDLSSGIKGFDYGRFDLKVPSYEDLYAGRNITILEVNGVNSEPAHIYDPDYRLLRAYGDIARHMKIIFRISKQNHRKGIPYASFSQLLIDLKNHLYPRQKSPETPVK